MKREFLQNLHIGDQVLSKEVIDAIMEENGKDINAAKAAAVKPYADYDDLMAENARLRSQQAETTVDGKNAQQWKEAHDRAVADHQAALFQRDLHAAIYGAGGRNAKAITALLDVESLQASENPQTAMEKALQELKAQEGYLFGTQTPPPYARGTGTQRSMKETAPTDLAGALREKFERK